jgi:hypothetical protein
VSKGTESEQAQGLPDPRACSASDPFACFYSYSTCTFAANCTLVCWPYSQFSSGEIQSHERYPKYFTESAKHRHGILESASSTYIFSLCSHLSQKQKWLQQLVLASFPVPSPTTPPHLPLLMKSFQTLFPPLSPQTLTLSSARRVVLISYNPDRGTVDFRHYVITVKPYGVSKRVRRILEGAAAKKSASSTSTGFLDLGNEKDVADFLLRGKGEPGPDGGYESAASSTESVAGDEGDAVNLADDYVGRNNKKGQRRAVRLDEIGPRMELRLVKIAEGVPGKEGSVIYHEFGEFAVKGLFPGRTVVDLLFFSQKIKEGSDCYESGACFKGEAKEREKGGAGAECAAEKSKNNGG